jgi:hypothetical protein
MNEYGLFFDFAAATYDLSKLHLKNPYRGFLMWEVLGKCKTVSEALAIIKNYDYDSPSQVLIADAEGNSAMINPEGIIEKKGDFQVNANCNIIDNQVSCRRPEIANEMLSAAKENNLALHKRILDKAHQEGNLTTIYSTICDLKRGIEYVYFFHDFNTAYKIDIKKELKKGYRIENLVDHFSASFAYENFSKDHPLYRKEAILYEMHDKGMENTIDHYISADKTGKDSTLSSALLEVALQLVKYAFNEHKNGGMWDYWFSLPQGFTVKTFQDGRLKEAARVLKYLLDKQHANKKLQNFITEMYAYVNLVQGDKNTAKIYYQQAIADPKQTYDISYKRAKEMLDRIL